MTASSSPAPSHRFRIHLAWYPLIGIAIIAMLIIGIFVIPNGSFAQNGDATFATPAAEATAPAGADQLTVTFDELNDSGIKGTATFTALSANQTLVDITVTGAGKEHPVRIYDGTCTDPATDALYRLAAVHDDGRSRSIISTSLTDLIARGTVIQMHMAPDTLGTVIACATIDGELMPATPTAATPQASATATPQASATATPAPNTTPAPNLDGTGGANGKATSATVELPSWNETDTSGTAVFTAVGDQTNVTVMLQGDMVSTGVALHLHSGTCQVPGDDTIELNPLSSDLVSTTIVDLPLTTILDGRYMINVHPENADWDTWLTCAELTRGNVAIVSSQPTATAQTLTGQGGTTSRTAVTPQPPAGVGVNTTLGASSAAALPAGTGVGSSLPWPTSPREAIIWASTIAALILASAGVVMRRAERRSVPPSRWTRLGI